MSSSASRAHSPARSRGARSASSTTFEGRLVYPTGHGQRTLIVECHRSAEGLTIRLPEFNEAANYLTDATVELTSVSEDGDDAPPVITGHSRVVADQEIDSDTSSALEHWPAGIRGRYFRITATPDPAPGLWRQGRHAGRSSRIEHGRLPSEPRRHTEGG